MSVFHIGRGVLLNKKLYTLVEISLLASFISVSGSIKIPTLIMGSEFQMSAPVAVAICAVFGFKRYIIAGIISSVLLFLLGIHTLINVEIAMVFRLIVGLIISLGGKHIWIIIIAGPIGTFIARIVLAFTLQLPLMLLVFPAIPGMVLTAIISVPLTKALGKIVRQVGVRQYGKAL